MILINIYGFQFFIKNEILNIFNLFIIILIQNSMNTDTNDLVDIDINADDDITNRCLGCGVDMGECNPRQYCCKTYCPYEVVQNNIIHNNENKQN
jgi:hypothetical protein